MIRWDSGTWVATGGPLCPDLLTLDRLGAADTARGRLVRMFFRLLDLVWRP